METALEQLTEDDVPVTAETRICRRACGTCPFSAGGIELTPEKMRQIAVYLSRGKNHYCHSDRTNRTICRGGRDLQLRLWTSQRIIAEPTDEALAAAMRKAGVEPGPHIVPQDKEVGDVEEVDRR